MGKKMLSYVLILLLTNLACFSTVQAQQNEKHTAKVKTAVSNNGTGPAVAVKLFDGRKINGQIQEIKDDRFTVIEEKTNAKSEILYSQVKEFKGRSPHSHKGIWVTVGIAAFLVFLGAIIATGDGV